MRCALRKQEYDELKDLNDLKMPYIYTDVYNGSGGNDSQVELCTLHDTKKSAKRV